MKAYCAALRYHGISYFGYAKSLECKQEVVIMQALPVLLSLFFSFLNWLFSRRTVVARAASWEASERELISARALWRAHLDLLSKIDELESCITPLRLAGETERLDLLAVDQRR